MSAVPYTSCFVFRFAVFLNSKTGSAHSKYQLKNLVQYANNFTSQISLVEDVFNEIHELFIFIFK
jgi:hypothetical protein